MTPPPSGLFRQIVRLQGDRPWGRFLDAGAGVNSALWGLSLPTKDWTGVTASTVHARAVRVRTKAHLRRQDRLLIGDWTDPALLQGEVFDTVVADYLLGAVEGFAPYFQARLFTRLKPHVGERLYVVGLDPYIIGDAPTPASAVVREIGRLRDACLLMADEIPYREYPAEWVTDQLTSSGFDVQWARRFPNRYREKWIHAQLDMALLRVARLKDRAVASTLQDHIRDLRLRALDICRAEEGLRRGADYVILAAPRAARKP